MVPDLHIQRLERGLYEARVCEGSTEIFEPTVHDTITDALRSIGQDVPRDLAHFIEIHYADVSIGTKALDRLASEPGVLADELVALAAAVWDAEEEIESLRTGAVALSGEME